MYRRERPCVARMSSPSSLCVYILLIGCCFSVSEALFFDLGLKFAEREIQLLKNFVALENAYEAEKLKYGSLASSLLLGNQDPELDMNASELITSKGYPCENHDVVTEDGFILGLQRIPHGLKDKDSNKTRPVAYIQHALLGSSTNFLTNLANESLAYVLADAGYDVWLGNSRGNTYSRRHIKYPETSEKFWAWSFDEMAQYDLSASLNYVTNYTNQESVYYIGHSQGTLIGFMGFSENKELAKKIKLMIAMGPVFTVGFMTSPLRLFTRLSDSELFHILGRKSFLPKNEFLDFMAKTVCANFLTRHLCLDAIELIAGSDDQHFNVSRLPVYISHCPAGTSVRNINHFAQNYRMKKCLKYDFGSSEENIAHYGQATPPAYNLTDMTVPVALYSGGKDPLADPRDVAMLSKKLKHVVLNKSIKGWAHLDFMWAMDAPQLLYYEMIKLMKKF